MFQDLTPCLPPYNRGQLGLTPFFPSTDLFAHFSGIQGSGVKTLKENQKVSFEVTTGPKGDQAVNIKPVA